MQLFNNWLFPDWMWGICRKYFASSTLNTFAWLNVRCLGASKQERECPSTEFTSGLCSIQCCDKNLSGHCLSARLKAALRQTRRKSTDSVGGVFSASVSVNTNHFFAGLPWNVFSVNNECRLIPKQCVPEEKTLQTPSRKAVESVNCGYHNHGSLSWQNHNNNTPTVSSLYVHCSPTVSSLFTVCGLKHQSAPHQSVSAIGVILCTSQQT